MSTVSLTVTRPVLFQGERHEVGEQIECSPHHAADLLDSGRVELANPDDVSVVAVSRSEALDRALAIARRRIVEDQPPIAPWSAVWRG